VVAFFANDAHPYPSSPPTRVFTPTVKATFDFRHANNTYTSILQRFRNVGFVGVVSKNGGAIREGAKNTLFPMVSGVEFGPKESNFIHHEKVVLAFPNVVSQLAALVMSSTSRKKVNILETETKGLRWFATKFVAKGFSIDESWAIRGKMTLEKCFNKKVLFLFGFTSRDFRGYLQASTSSEFGFFKYIVSRIPEFIAECELFPRGRVLHPYNRDHLMAVNP
jgi:hypothetical protein